MGRYAQRRRSGGGTPALTPLASITSVETDGTDQIINWDRPVNAADFALTDFVYSDGFQNPLTIIQANPIRFDTTTAVGLSSGTLTYAGDVPAVVSPQTIDITPL